MALPLFCANDSISNWGLVALAVSLQFRIEWFMSQTTLVLSHVSNSCGLQSDGGPITDVLLLSSVGVRLENC